VGLSDPWAERRSVLVDGFRFWTGRQSLDGMSVCYRWIGVISPARSQPRGSPLAAR
jgi:hypothetical protein